MERLHRRVVRAARAVALVGGAVLIAVIAVTGLSILGRAANGALHAALEAGLAPGLAEALLDTGVGAITGDFELVEAGMAFAIFAFLPLCQVTAGHAVVTVATDALPLRARRVLVLLAEGLFAAVLVAIAVQLSAALGRAMGTGQTTFLLQMPVWWSYAASLAGAVAAAAAGVWMVLVRAVELVTGRAVAGTEA